MYKRQHVNYDIIPGVVYTSPEVATVGKTEEQLNSKNITYKVDSLNVLKTYGKKGASFNETRLKAPEIEIVNSNGAGDALLGTFLANQINNKNIEQSLRDAITYASEVCKTSGPRLE